MCYARVRKYNNIRARCDVGTGARYNIIRVPRTLYIISVGPVIRNAMCMTRPRKYLFTAEAVRTHTRIYIIRACIVRMYMMRGGHLEGKNMFSMYGADREREKRREVEREKTRDRTAETRTVRATATSVPRCRPLCCCDVHCCRSEPLRRREKMHVHRALLKGV